uniref:Uncharacterized protein LOC104211084 n=1 Tax=Nicotiana sylvestris TaxID=4096 RepID=A0A1U7V999_NICSY|nr:PREDICTED: uncharacterized protein LOC104211084 [Nicotiana sylvestris]
MKSLLINVTLVEALEQMPNYAKFMKDLVTIKWSMNFETTKVTHQVTEIVHSMAPKLEDPGAFTIPCTIGSVEFSKSLSDLGSNCEVDYEVLIIIGRPFLATGKAHCDVEVRELTFRVGDESAPNWSVRFKLMCDASDVAVGASLGQCINKIFHPVYYASKTINSAQFNYTVTGKELLAIVFAIEK